ncbi:hypothetical protein JG687_00011844 [Phytophthora cactorum]|uniref:Uncharacterized protein n=1 Tax=Phytophthora cactorum TaxID=29920 RepID=A0A329S7J4_9STRA|nr:hypothetical protein Pcac1_g28022 [Phytophthora cactorum]KAG2825234.1 hypothetical protein PC111_g9484 [Phytophthora cactorum]KAG2908611.1 hypothetical protein PC114_g10397 [Phytophthora cactorum]KAG2924236.1 hypothetical protein PC115_g8719 [Phytophthora cactorum]KAG3220458.1 hypothetical protein PC129_g8792 [Phytophthora cactorum]
MSTRTLALVHFLLNLTGMNLALNNQTWNAELSVRPRTALIKATNSTVRYSTYMLSQPDDHDD